MQNLRLHCVTPSKQKRRGKLSLGVWLLRDNAPVHKSLAAQQAVAWLWICSTKPSYLYSRPRPQWLLSVQKSIILLSWNPVCRRRIAYSCCWSVVWRTGESILFSMNKQLSRKVAKLHRCCRRLYWKMTIYLKVCGSLLYESCKTFWTPLVGHETNKLVMISNK